MAEFPLVESYKHGNQLASSSLKLTNTVLKPHGGTNSAPNIRLVQQYNATFE